MFKAPTTLVADLTSRIEAAKQVSACRYETGTSWGQEVYVLTSFFLTMAGSATQLKPKNLY